MVSKQNKSVDNLVNQLALETDSKERKLQLFDRVVTRSRNDDEIDLSTCS